MATLHLVSGLLFGIASTALAYGGAEQYAILYLPAIVLAIAAAFLDREDRR